jgi:hypothetical protein
MLFIAQFLVKVKNSAFHDFESPNMKRNSLRGDPCQLISTLVICCPCRRQAWVDVAIVCPYVGKSRKSEQRQGAARANMVAYVSKQEEFRTLVRREQVMVGH